MDKKYDVVIVGGACAGLSAALYTARRALKTLIITKDIGGQIATTTEVENYPGTGTLMGPELAENFRKQAEAAGAEIEFGEVTSLSKNGEEFVIESSLGTVNASAVILSFGLEHRHLGVPGEDEYSGKGVTYCATCDGPLFKGKTVAVVGGGNSAIDAAEYLSHLCEKVYVLVRGEALKGENVLAEALHNTENVEVMLNTSIKEIVGEQFVTGLKLVNNKDQSESDLDVNGVFVEIGWQTKTDFLKDLVELNDRGFIITNNKGETSLPGLYAAGDVTDTPFKQAVISAGEGAKAALAAAEYLQKKRGAGAGAASPDWTRRDKKR